VIEEKGNHTVNSAEKRGEHSNGYHIGLHDDAAGFAFPIESSEGTKSAERNQQTNFMFDVDTFARSNNADGFATATSSSTLRRDIVNTEWDIPKISFPSEEEVLKTTNEDGTAKIDAATTQTELPLFPMDQPRSQAMMNADAVAQTFDFNSIIQGASQAEEAKAGSHKMDDPTARRSHKAIAISAVAVVAVAAMAFGGVNMVRRHNDTVEFRSAMKTCTAASSAYSKAYAKLGSLLLNTKTEQGITADQVADAATVKDLQNAVSAANRIGVAESCQSSLSPATLKNRAKETAELTAALKKSATAVPVAAKAVSASKGVKDAAVAAGIKQNLQSAVTDAQTLLDNSLYAVADNQTRVSLEEAIDSANEVLKAAGAAEASAAGSSKVGPSSDGSNSTDPDKTGSNNTGSSSESESDLSSTQPTLDVSAMQAALTALQQASNAVTSSMNDFVVQNQLAAQNSTRTYTYSYANTGTGGSGTSGSTSSGDAAGGATGSSGSGSSASGSTGSSGSGSNNNGSGSSTGGAGNGNSSGDTGSEDGNGSGVTDGD
jgi:hypothetical protein